MSPQQRTGIIVLSVFGGIFLLSVFGVVAMVMANRSPATAPAGNSGGLFGPSKPRADREGMEWTHRELVDHLGRNGVELTYWHTDLNDRDGPAIRYAGDVLIQRCTTPDKAKELAGLSSSDIALNWGRFRISASPDTLARIRQVLN